MLSRRIPECTKFHVDSGQIAPCALWPLDLKLTHVSCNPADTLVHFQGQYLTICQLDYDILQMEIQNVCKTKAAGVEVGEFCLVEDVLSNRWYRGRVQNHQKDLFDVFLMDYGNVLSVEADHLATALDELFMLPPKIMCGFFANVLPLREKWDFFSEKYFTSLIGSDIKGYIHALLPHKVVILEAPSINSDLFRLSLGRHVDTDTFLLLVEILTELPVKQNIEPVPDLLIEKQDEQEMSFKLFSFKGFKDILLFSGPKITSGQKSMVRITAAVSPGSFYCQMADMVKDLKEMSDKLALYCEPPKKLPSQKVSDNLGLLCSAKGKDGKWHRGFVQFLPVYSQVRVLFVDYGYCESVKVDHVLQLSPDFLSTPIMAFPCALSCLTGQDEALKIQQVNCFKKGLLGGDLDVKIDGFDQEQNLYSVTIFSSEDYAAVVETDTTQDVSKQKNDADKTAIVQAMDNSVIVEEIQVNSVLEGHVEFVLNPGAFWLRTNKRNQDFEEMMKDMYKHFSQAKLDEGILENPEPGALCCAMYEVDLRYYRAIVTDTLDYGAEVFFIDFGNTDKIPFMFIKQIPEKFAIEPAFALSCSLVNVVPFDDVWTSFSTNYFRQVVSDKALVVHIVNITKDRYVVDLYEKDYNASQSAVKSITELLTTTKHAEYWEYPPAAPVIPKGAMEKVLITQKTCENMKVIENGSKMLGVPRSIRKMTCEISRKDGFENTPEVLKSRTPINLAPAVIFKELKFKPGSEIAVRCSHINTPSDFWCQLQNKVPNLEEMMEAIQKYYQKHTLPFQSGASCCVVKSQDSRWYRACIIGVEKDAVKVIFVDYGTIANVKMYNLQAILPEFLELDGQAFRCSLYNLIEPANGSSSDWGPEACTLLKEFAQGQSVNLTCSIHAQLYVKHKGLCNVVNLYNTYQNATKKLVEEGLAREVKSPFHVAPSVCPESFVHSSFDLRCGSVEQVYVTHVCSPWEMYCQLDRNTEIIDDLMKKVAKESEEIQRANSGHGIGKLCLAKYDEDGQWYRGVAHPIKGTLHVNVFFVDYGNVHIVEKRNVISIPRHSADLQFTPMQALRCSLSHIKKEDNFAVVKKWMEESILNKPLRAVVVGKNDDGAVFLYLYDGELNINKKIKDLIESQKPKEKESISAPVNADKGLNEQMTNPTRITKDRRFLKPRGKKVSAHNMNKPQKQSSNALKTNSSKCPDAQKGLEDKDKDEESSEGKARQIDVQTVFHIHLPKLTQLPSNPKIKSGFRGLGFVSHINDVHSFFIQMQEDEENIVKIGEDLNSDLLRDVIKNNSMLVDFRINDLVAAEFEEDGALYRAVVRGQASNDKFKVEFIDYGNTATVTKDKICTLTNALLMQCRLSIHCSLVNSDSYKNDATFIDAVMGNPLMVKVVRPFGTQWEVEIEIQQGNQTLQVHYEKSNNVTEHEIQASCASLVDPIEKQPKGPGQEHKSPSDKKTESESVMLTAQEETILLNVPPCPSPTKHKQAICQDQHSRMADGITTPSNQLRSTTTERSVELVKKSAIPSQDIRAGQTENVTLLSISENGEMYLKLHERKVQVADLDNLLVKNLSACKIMLEENVKEGVECLAKSTKDDRWHRAIVRHVSIDHAKCTVFLVDHGTTDYVSLNCIKEICMDLKDTPLQAVLCKWNGSGLPISKANVIMKETLKPLIGKDMKVMFVSYSDVDNLWVMEIMLNGQFLQQMIMADFEIAKERPHPKNTAVVTQSENQEPRLDNSPQRLFLAPVNMDLGYSGLAAAVTTPVEFYIVLEESLVIMNTVLTILKDLPEVLSPLREEHLMPMSCCLVWSESKNKWCRAEIVHLDETLVVVNLVDYGHCVDLPYTDRCQLRRLPDTLARLPKVAYPCTLRGVKPVKGQWTDEAVVFFQKCLCLENLQIYFRQFISDALWEADVVANGVYVAKRLVDAGHAEYTDIMLRLRFQEQSPIQILQQKTYSPEQELITTPRTSTHPRQPTVDLQVYGSTSSEDASSGQGSQKAGDNVASAIEICDGQEVEKMAISSTMTGATYCTLM
ncbi:hypothetical protein DPEC_G00084770 [Dallia pectoralis]|uniref:Uncharacterized protein n=1 Tax=Dallia pectoralis TaxID=75939 RepID=A0ACC2GZG1_DALPE|nr:hypothetical protein DPEC_G00084770 [Dallia pectoralis]